MIKSLLLATSCVLGSGAGALQKNAPVFNHKPRITDYTDGSGYQGINAIYFTLNQTTYETDGNDINYNEKLTSAYRYHFKSYKASQQIEAINTAYGQVTSKYFWQGRYGIRANQTNRQEFDARAYYEVIYIQQITIDPTRNWSGEGFYEQQNIIKNLYNDQWTMDKKIESCFLQTTIIEDKSNTFNKTYNEINLYDAYEYYLNQNNDNITYLTSADIEVDQSNTLNIYNTNTDYGQTQNGATNQPINSTWTKQITENSTITIYGKFTLIGFNRANSKQNEQEIYDSYTTDTYYNDYFLWRFNRPYRSTGHIKNQTNPTPTPTPPSTDYEVVDISGLMFDILTLPFAFVSKAFNITLFAGTAYAINISQLFLGIFAALTVVFIIRKFIKK